MWNLFKINNKDNSVMSVFLNISMSVRSFWCCTWICFSIYLSIIYFIWYMARYTMGWTCVPHSVTRSTKLQGSQCSPKLAFRSTDFLVPENLIFSALFIQIPKSNPRWIQTFLGNFETNLELVLNQRPNSIIGLF